MKDSEDIKKIVREKYAQIALQSKEMNEASCCGVGCCDPADESQVEVYNIMSESYDALVGYNRDADLGLGCGLPTEFARIQKGQTVLDLGSGAGNDCFVARAETGPEGKVIGVDFTPEMIRRARQNADSRGFNNVEFREGDIENLPIGDASVDVVVSNCVLNLVPDKAKVFAEIHRVLRPGGHFSISDVVLVGNLPEPLLKSAEMHAGCVSGAMQMADYLQLIHDAGFENRTIQKQKPILVPDRILRQHLSESELENFKQAQIGIWSITVYAEKAGAEGDSKMKMNLPLSQLGKSEKPCCPPGCCD